MRRELLAKAASGRPLERPEALEIGRELAAGRSEPLATAAFLGALAARGETPQELAGLAEAFRESVAPFPQLPDAVDTCGTGGDGRGTFNLSTAAAIVAASLGVAVAKHGNRSVSSSCGSADVLSALGYPVDEPPDEAADRLDRCGFAFLFAPRYHPAMAHVAPVRRALGVRTVFNLLGPLLNPAGVRRQVVGVFDLSCAQLMAGALLGLGTERALVIHGEGGYDEAILHGPVHVLEVRRDKIQRYTLFYSDFGLPPGRAADLAGGDARENARTLEALLDGGGPPGLREAVAANAALALRAAGACDDLAEGARRAEHALASGRSGRYFRGVLGIETEARRAYVS